MADYSNPYRDVNGKLNKKEMIHQLRSMIDEELYATTLYENLAEVTDDELIKSVLLDIAKEELVHAGEFLALIEFLNSEDIQLIDNGMSEVDDKFKNKRI